MGKLVVSTSPHIRSTTTTMSIMRDVLIALGPATVAAVVLFGWRALLLIAVSVVSAVAAEFLFNLITKKTQTVGDLSAAVTGLILALNVNTKTTVWQMIVGAVFAVIVVKCLFGGIGCNFANPAATARVFLIVSFGEIAGGVKTQYAELVGGATPLGNLAEGIDPPSLLDMFIGNRGGSLGETCAIALLIGFAYLVIRRVIAWQVPTVFVGTVFVLSWIITGDVTTALYYVLSGGLLFGAIFMATDYVTSPIRTSGRMIFALGCGIITVLIRFYGSYPAGVSFAILIMNILSPYIDKLTEKVQFGGKKK